MCECENHLLEIINNIKVLGFSAPVYIFKNSNTFIDLAPAKKNNIFLSLDFLTQNFSNVSRKK